MNANRLPEAIQLLEQMREHSSYHPVHTEIECVCKLLRRVVDFDTTTFTSSELVAEICKGLDRKIPRCKAVRRELGTTLSIAKRLVERCFDDNGNGVLIE